ncbi:ATP-binding protein [Actinoplanes sp. NPDC051346]|uniref:sensor histidine kinase n=1 Tax=Actinoplanes sp. NPDC051346 TaxID=3155048 RepID=UPI003434F5EE
MTFTRWLRAVGPRGTALAAATLTLGLGTGAAATAGIAAAERDATAAALTLRSASVRTALDTAFQRYADTMHDIATAAATQPAATLPSTVARIAGSRLAGAHQVVVTNAAGGILAQHTVDGSTPPPRVTLDPEPRLAETMRLARDNGRLVAGPVHVLPSDRGLPAAGQPAAFDLVAPVYGAGFRGWVVVAVRAPELLRQSLRAADVTGVAAVVTETTADGGTHEIARWTGDGSPAGALRDTVDVVVAGTVWHVLVRPTAALVGAARTPAAPLAMLGATVISLLAAAGLLTAEAGRKRAQAAARREAADAAAAHDRAQAAHDRAQAAQDRARAAEDRARAAGESARDQIRATEESARERLLAVEQSARQQFLATEDALLTAEDALREREAELSGFAAAAGEHLHAPLHTIASVTEMLVEDAAPQLDQASRGFLERIGTSTRRMLSTVDELIAYTSATDTALKPEAIDATGLTLGVVAGRLDRAGDRRPGIEVDDLPAVMVDAHLLGEVVGHLVDNALRFVRHDTAPRITIGAREHAPGWWRIEVSDRGIGVPEEQRDRIFAPFHRAPAAEGFPGIGLGLAVCRRIVALHGGEIGVDPNPGGGSIFWFTVAAATTEPLPGTELFAADLA